MKKNIQVRQSTCHYSEYTHIISQKTTKTMKASSIQKSMWILLALSLILIVTGCAHSENVEPCLTGHTYGFLGGLWHGFIAPFDFIGMLFDKKITMYAQNNNGGLYALGFLLGSGGWGFFGGKGTRRIRTTRMNVNSQNFDHAEIVE
jgi:hypothetical protein